MSEKMLIEGDTISAEENVEIAELEELSELAAATEAATDGERRKSNFRRLLKKPLFWEIAVGAVALVCGLVFVLVALSKPAEPTPTPETEAYIPETTAAPTEPATEPTTPQPEANPIPLNGFETKDEYLSCVAVPSSLGVDISAWQGGNIDWEQVKAAGIEFAMIRVAWRGELQGEIHDDEYAQTNYAGASAAGIKVGAYFYSQATTTQEAVEEAQYLLEHIKDWDVQMPLVFDWEDGDGKTRTDHVDARTLTDCAKAFCQVIENAGYTPMIYFSISQSIDRMYLLELEDYQFWLAYYDTVMNYPYKVEMWQYTDRGEVPGIDGNVDIDLYFTYPE